MFHLLLVSVICQQLFFVCLGTEVATDEMECCIEGAPGLNGRDGANGRDGKDGRDGRDGVCSIADIEGLKGEKGEPGIDGVSPTSPASSTQTVYIRWGKITCPETPDNDTTLLYEGLVGGTHYGHPGGGAEYLCLPLDPIFDEFAAGVGGSRAFLYGAEYEINSAGDVYNSLHNYEVPCAVCLAPRGTLLNVPARNVCPSGWVLEYSGYLMASYYNHAGSKQHICVDKDPDVRGTNDNQDGALMYFVEGRCGSLPCGPYVDGSELTCAVCTI